MKNSCDSAPLSLLRLLLLAELFACSWSRPAHIVSICSSLRPMIHQVDKLMNAAGKLHNLTENELINFLSVDNNLDALPHIEHTAETVRLLKMNETLSLLFAHTQAFRLHMDWITTAKENLSLPSQPAEGASTHLLQLSELLKTSLLGIGEKVPESPPASLPAVSSSFEALQVTVELSDRLQTFCHWSKTLLRLLQRRSRCPRH